MEVNGYSKRKLRTYGTIDKFKARLVVHGFNQKKCTDYSGTNSPVTKVSTIHVLMAIPSIYNLVIHYMDLKTAVLNSDLMEEIYIKHT